MKNFEERYTAWIDGMMSEAERAEFEAGIDDLGAALRDREDARRVGELLRTSFAPAKLVHGDFLNSQVLAEIQRSSKKREGAAPIHALFPIRRLVFAGALCGVLAIAVTLSLLPRGEGELDEASLLSNVISARTADPKHSATTFAVKGGKGSVIWVQGMDFVPSDEAIQKVNEKASESKQVR